MSWICEHQRNWRIALLVLMMVAFMGPWTYDRIYVPSEYECSAPNFRLEGDFCGIPMSGIRFYFWIGGGFIPFWVGLVTGEFAFPERIRELIFISLILFIPLLPIISTLLLILRGENQRRQVFTIIALILAIGMGLFWGLINNPNFFWGVWGVWLYLEAVISTLILEILVILSNRKDPEMLADAESTLL